MRNIQNRIMDRPHEIFRNNGSIAGRDLDDWLQAERELVWKPPIKLREDGNEFHLEVPVPGIDARDLTIKVTPEDILIQTLSSQEHETGNGTNSSPIVSPG
jgi:HSP20 family molecular chaperone IbpA